MILVTCRSVPPQFWQVSGINVHVPVGMSPREDPCVPGCLPGFLAGGGSRPSASALRASSSLRNSLRVLSAGPFSEGLPFQPWATFMALLRYAISSSRTLILDPSLSVFSSAAASSFLSFRRAAASSSSSSFTIAHTLHNAPRSTFFSSYAGGAGRDTMPDPEHAGHFA